jgi:hypothetical protein
MLEIIIAMVRAAVSALFCSSNWCGTPGKIPPFK